MGLEAPARQRIDELLAKAGWSVQDAQTVNLYAGNGVAVREFRLMPGHGQADYLLYVDGKAAGVVEAKPVGFTLTGVERQRYYCRRESEGSALSTNLQLYSLREAAKGWNDLVETITLRGLGGVDELKERLVFILVCLGLSLSQLLGQNSPFPDRDRMDQPGALLSNILARSHVDRTTRRRLYSTFQDFLSYYDSVRHFGRDRDEKNYRTIDRLTIEEMMREFRGHNT
jgi:hypothetical protein